MLQAEASSEEPKHHLETSRIIRVVEIWLDRKRTFARNGHQGAVSILRMDPGVFLQISVGGLGLVDHPARQRRPQIGTCRQQRAGGTADVPVMNRSHGSAGYRH